MSQPTKSIPTSIQGQIIPGLRIKLHHTVSKHIFMPFKYSITFPIHTHKPACIMDVLILSVINGHLLVEVDQLVLVFGNDLLTAFVDGLLCPNVLDQVVYD